MRLIAIGERVRASGWPEFGGKLNEKGSRPFNSGS